MENNILNKIDNVTSKIGGIVMAISYFPQIASVITNKSSQGLNLAFISLVTLGLMTFTFNGYVVYKNGGKLNTLIAQLANLIPALILLIISVIYM